MDFVKDLDNDTSLSILSRLDDPSDIVRVTAVSRLWRDFVINYSLSKNLCVKLFKQLSNVVNVIEPSNARNEESSEAESSSHMDTRLLAKEHRVYTLLARGCTSCPIQSCIADAIIASSTDNFPVESILNTLEEQDRFGQTPSYWSSTGQRKTSVPETLLYKLIGDLCVITEIKVQPFKEDKKGEPGESSVESNYVWTFTSQEFPMAQENQLQTFTLPEPALCIGGYVLVEFLGRVQTQESDGLYYICVSHVKVMGRSLAKSFQVENLDESGKFGLKVLSYSDPEKMVEADAEAELVPSRQMRNLERFLNLLHRRPLDININYVYPHSDNEDTESEDEEV